MATDTADDRDAGSNAPVTASEPAIRSGGKPAPERRCIVRRDSGATDCLIRFVLDPEGVVTPDLAEKLPGRGAWVTASTDDIVTAIDRNLFAKSFRQPAKIPDDLAERVHELMRARTLDWLALARRAGQAVSGYDKVSDWINQDNAAILIQARDASDKGRQKLAQGASDLPRYINLFDAAEMGARFGRDIAVHVAIARGSMAKQIKRDLERLAGLVGPQPPVTGPP